MPLKATIPQVTINPTKPKTEEPKALFFPRWDCFCCCDTGTVTPHNCRKVDPEYHLSTHPQIACVRSGCYANGTRYAKELLGPDICQLLHDDYRQDWIATVKQWQENTAEMEAKQNQVMSAIAAIGGA